MSAAKRASERRVESDHVLAVRVGHGANCSSIGSVVDTLYATATVGAAVFATVLAAMGREEVTVVAPRREDDEREVDPLRDKSP